MYQIHMLLEVVHRAVWLRRLLKSPASVSRVLQQMQVDKRLMQDDKERREIKMMESMKSTVQAAFGKLSGDLQRDLEHWEGIMDDKVRAQLTSH